MAGGSELPFPGYAEGFRQALKPVSVIAGALPVTRTDIGWATLAQETSSCLLYKIAHSDPGSDF